MTTNIEKWTDIAPTASGDRSDRQHPVIGRFVELAGGLRIRPHSHDRAQLLFAPQGPLRVATASGTWSMSADQAIWIPSRIEHSVLAYAPLAIHTLFIEAEIAREWALPEDCRVLALTALMREFILRLAAQGENPPTDARHLRLGAAALDELAGLQPTPLHLPLAGDPQLRRIMLALMSDPGNTRDLQAWADWAGMTSRTLTRRFLRETGLNFAQWRMRLRLIEGMERLQRGHPVTRVALDLGYRSPSAFVAMFRRELGLPPGQLRRQVASGRAPFTAQPDTPGLPAEGLPF
jgi:AraC-like DNA-binding protein/quercetin dioxygenase-like cupin family protein